MEEVMGKNFSHVQFHFCLQLKFKAYCYLSELNGQICGGVLFQPYCLNTIFQKLHFSKSHFYETLQEKYSYVIFLQPKSRFKCCKNFENRLTNKIIMPKNYFE